MTIPKRRKDKRSRRARERNKWQDLRDCPKPKKQVEKVLLKQGEKT